MGLVSMVRSHPRQNLGNISPLFSGYTISGKIIIEFCLGLEGIMETDLIYVWSGGIRTYLYPLESKPNFYMHLNLIVVVDILEDG